MIESADEYRQWWGGPPSRERSRALREPLSDGVLRDVVERFPECRADVARHEETPLELLHALRNDDDEGVRWRVRSNGRWLAEHPEDADPWRDDPATPIQFRLTKDERHLLSAGLREWGGPAYCTEELAVAMGFQSLDNLFKQGGRIADGIAQGRAQSRADWTRALLSAEIAFASNVMGSGLDWPITTGLDDEVTIQTLRGLQRKIVTRGVLGVVFGNRPQG